MPQAHMHNPNPSMNVLSRGSAAAALGTRIETGPAHVQQDHSAARRFVVSYLLRIIPAGCPAATNAMCAAHNAPPPPKHTRPIQVAGCGQKRGVSASSGFTPSYMQQARHRATHTCYNRLIPSPGACNALIILYAHRTSVQRRRLGAVSSAQMGQQYMQYTVCSHGHSMLLPLGNTQRTPAQ